MWPESGRPLRVEAASLGRRPVGFMLIGPWLTPWPMPGESAAGDRSVYVLILFVLALLILAGAGWLVRRNLREGHGDRRGAVRLACCMTGVLMALWACDAHLTATLLSLALFLLAVCTSVFYGVVIWAIYLAFEPFVRRTWPQVLVSSTNVLTGRFSDPVVGRDVLIGVALGLWLTLLVRSLAAWSGAESLPAFPGDLRLLLGVRSTAAVVLEEAIYAIRNVFLYGNMMLFVAMVAGLAAWAFTTATAGRLWRTNPSG